MASTAWFDEYAYLTSKLNQLTSSGVTGFSTTTQVKDAIEANGMTTFQHFSTYSLAERTSPDDYFNTNEYLAAKAVQLNTLQGVTTWTGDKVALALQNAGYTNAYDHFTSIGWTENVNPSNAFDVSSYLDQKATATGLTVAEVTAAFQANGFDPISHYMYVGDTETGISVTPVPVSEQVTPDASGSAGQTFTLTTGIDNIVGTSGNDTIIGSDTTLSNADQINGGAGTDILKIYAAAAPGTALGTISNIETIFVNGVTGSIDVSGKAGVTGLVIDNTSAAANVFKVANQTITLQNDTAGNGGSLQFGATDTAANLTVSKVGAIASGAITYDAVDINTGALVTTMNLTSDTAANYIALTNTANVMKTLNISGDKAVTIQTAAGYNKITTVNAATDTGGVTFDGAAQTADTTLAFTGGTGNDTVIFKAGYLLNTVGVADVLVGGTGTDTLVINDTAPVYAAINAATGFEVLGINTTAATIDIAQITNGINKFNVGLGNTGTAANLSETFNNSLSTTAYTIDTTATSTGTVTINNKVGEAITTIALDNQSGAAKTIAGVTLVGATTVNLSSDGATGSSNVITTLTNVENSNIVVTGSKDLTISNALVGAVTGSKIDASAFTGKLVATGSGVSDILIGGTAADKFVSGTGADVMTGGAGADTFIYNGGVASVFTDSLATTAGMDTITDFVAGTDKIALVNTGAPVTSVVVTNVTVATAADVATLLTAIGTQVAATVGGAEQIGVVTVTAGAMAGTYLMANDLVNAAAATDTLIKMTGVTGTITAADFVFTA
ncbi:MAG: beta strand repeat-containing protein [Desulfobulbus sp.]